MREYIRRPLDAYKVMFQTSMARSYVRELLEQAAATDKDSERVERLTKCECKMCYYRKGRMAGQAFTGWACGICSKEAMHHNTAVPMVCLGCAQKHDVCVSCGADIELRERRRKFDWGKE